MSGQCGISPLHFHGKRTNQLVYPISGAEESLKNMSGVRVIFSINDSLGESISPQFTKLHSSFDRRLSNTDEWTKGTETDSKKSESSGGGVLAVSENLTEKRRWKFNLKSGMLKVRLKSARRTVNVDAT